MFYLCSVKLDVVLVMGAQEDLILPHARRQKIVEGRKVGERREKRKG